MILLRNATLSLLCAAMLASPAAMANNTKKPAKADAHRAAASKPAAKADNKKADKVDPAYAAESQLVNALLGAIQNKDYDQFIGNGTPNFGKLDHDQFASVAGQLGPRLQGGYQLQRLGDYRQQTYQFSLWKITFRDGGDDLIGTLNMQDGKVGGFVLR